MAKKVKRADIVGSCRSRTGNQEEDFITDLLGRAVEKLGKDLKKSKQLQVEKNVTINVYKDNKLN